MLHTRLPIQVRPYQPERLWSQRVRHLLAASGRSSRRLELLVPPAASVAAQLCTASSGRRYFAAGSPRTISGVNARCAAAAHQPPHQAWPRPAAAFSMTKALSAPSPLDRALPFGIPAKPPASARRLTQGASHAGILRKLAGNRADGVWALSYHFSNAGLKVSTRMTVIRLATAACSRTFCSAADRQAKAALDAPGTAANT